jgi:serpin B
MTAELRSVADSNNEFAVALKKRLNSRAGNQFFSPASISTALAMVYAGTAGETRQQMAAALHLELAGESLQDGYAALGKLLNRDNADYRLKMANRLWGARNYPFQPPFLATTREKYGAELAQLDFAASEQARDTINTWVAEQTNDKIQNLIPPGLLNELTRLVLTNAIYFKGSWDEQFRKNQTRDEPFHLAKGTPINVPTLHQSHDFGYFETDAVQVLQLPYAGNDLSMVVVLPKQVDGLAAVEAKLSAADLGKWVTATEYRKVRVSLPKFKLTSEFQLGETLQALGMELAFSDAADLSGISSAEGLKISDVIHKAYVDVNEEGTEAAAATAVGIVALSAPLEKDQPVVFQADHPFLFLIQDDRSGAILFLGRMADPTAAAK